MLNWIWGKDFFLLITDQTFWIPQRYKLCCDRCSSGYSVGARCLNANMLVVQFYSSVVQFYSCTKLWRCKSRMWLGRLFTAIPYRTSTGPEQGFPCVLFLTGKNLFSFTGIPANENRFFPVCEKYTGKTLFWPCTGPVRDCSVFFSVDKEHHI